MKIIFYSSGDNKLARLIAYIYLDLFSKDRLISKLEDIFFNNEEQSKNNLCFVGTGNHNYQVMALGCYKQNNIIINLITGLNSIFAIKEDIILINIDAIDNLFIKIGIIAINFKVKKIGLLLLERGVIYEMPRINRLVKELKEKVAKRI